MKLTAFLSLIIALHIATPGLSQRVSISGKNLSLEQVFAEIKKQTGFEFIYESVLLKTSRPVTLNVSEAPVDEVLKTCLQGQGLGFNIRNGTIVIFKLDESGGTEPPAADTPVLVRGRVIDSHGLPVEMASVVLVRTNAGTQTDRSGFFALKVKTLKATDSLNISFIGFKTRWIRPEDKRYPDPIVLQAADNVLDELMVAAYGYTSDRYRTGDITTIHAADIAKVPASNVVEALAGRVPGMYVWQANSNPGSVYTIQLRGVNVIPASQSMIAQHVQNVLSKPLIVVDGLPMAPDLVNENGENRGSETITGFSGAAGGQDVLYWLNPFDVESLSVLKDADATALYGSRAANGVILITTKKGKPGRTVLNISANTGVNTQAKKLKLLNTSQYLAMRHEAWNNEIRAGLSVPNNIGPGYTPDAGNSYDLLVWDTTRYTDWQKVLLGSAPVYNVNVGLSGGEGRTSYRLSAGYNGWKSAYPGVRQNPAFREEKGTFSLNVSTRSANDRLKLTSSVMSYVSASYQPTTSPDDYIFLAPDAPGILDATGNLNFADWRAASPLTSRITGNPLNILAIPYKSNWWGMHVRTSLSYELFRRLLFTMGVGYSRSEGRQVQQTPSSASDPLVISPLRMAQFGNSSNTGLNIEPALHYEIRMGRHRLALMGGGSFQSDRQQGDVLLASGYASDAGLSSPSSATSLIANSTIIERRSVSGLGRVNYRYADKYLVDLSARRDGSNSFGAGRRFGNFGSVGLGWIFTAEPWLKQLPLLTFGKLRGSYGITGSQTLNPYVSVSTFQPSPPTVIGSSYISPNGNGIYQGVTAWRITRIADPMLGWAQAASIDLGIDLYFLADQRLKLTAQWYRKRTGHQLVPKPVSTITGTTAYLANLPAEVQDAGYESFLSYTSPASPAGISWNVSGNIAANRNKLLSYPGLENSIYKDYYQVGEPLTRRILYYSVLNRSLGVNILSDSVHKVAFHQVGDYPTITGGLQATVSYRSFSLAISCTFAKQKGFTNVPGATYPGVVGDGGFDRSGLGNQPLWVVRNKHWQSPADSTIGGAFLATSFTYTGLDIEWGDASYIALKNASLSYRLPANLLHKAGIESMSVYIHAENLLLLSLSAYRGTNPEQPGAPTQVPLRMLLVGGFDINL